MTGLATTPETFRHTSRTTASEDELVAAFRIHLRDAGWPGAEHLDAVGVRAAVAEVQDEALALGCDVLEHLLLLKVERHARMQAPTCETCGTVRPLAPSQRERWGVLAGGAACGDCLELAGIPARSVAA